MGLGHQLPRGESVSCAQILESFLAAAALRTVFNAAEPGGFSRLSPEGQRQRMLANEVYWQGVARARA